MKITKSQLKQIVKEEISRVFDESDVRIDEFGLGRSIKGAAASLKAKGMDMVKGTGKLAQTTQAQKQIKMMVKDIIKSGDTQEAKSMANHLKALTDELAAFAGKDDMPYQ